MSQPTRETEIDPMYDVSLQHQVGGPVISYKQR